MKKKAIVLLIFAMMFVFVGCNNPASQGSGEVFRFKHGATEIHLNTEAAPVLDALGEELDYSESPSCAFEGLDRIYIYTGFRVQTYESKGKEYLYSVEITDDSVNTQEGITIGSSKDVVLGAYVSTDSSDYTATTDDNSVVCTSANGAYKLQILLREGKVTNIQYQWDPEA